MLAQQEAGFENINQSKVARMLTKFVKLCHVFLPATEGWKLCTAFRKSSGVTSARELDEKSSADVNHNDSQVVIHTSPGAAPVIARMPVLLWKPEGIFGIVDDKNTISSYPPRLLSQVAVSLHPILL